MTPSQPSDRLIATYQLGSTDIEKAAQAIAIGQSIGNPFVRIAGESPARVERYGARVEDIDGDHAVVSFPACNFGPSDGVSFLLSVLLGGQLDIDLLTSCRLLDVDFGPLLERFPGPRHGVRGVRAMLGADARPLVGGIVKPKLGLSPDELAEVCHEMADGGVDFIKEDEVLGDPSWCPLEERVSKVARALDGYRTIYAPCITADGGDLVRRAKRAHELGAGAVHLNIWSGLGAYSSVRAAVDIPIFFQKSGDKVLTTGPNSISSALLFKLIRLIGCDLAHVGMWGGYMDESEDDLHSRLFSLCGDWSDHPGVVPSLSCGAYPGMVQASVRRFGVDVMVSAGGYLHGHPMGTRAGAAAFRQAAEGATPAPPELAVAIDRWGLAE